MKRDATIIALALTLCALGGTMALAKSKFHKITFGQDMLVNGALVKKGEYQARFNEPNSELAILDAMLTKITFGGTRYSLLLSDTQAAEGR